MPRGEAAMNFFRTKPAGEIATVRVEKPLRAVELDAAMAQAAARSRGGSRGMRAIRSRRAHVPNARMPRAPAPGSLAREGGPGEGGPGAQRPCIRGWTKWWGPGVRWKGGRPSSGRNAPSKVRVRMRSGTVGTIFHEEAHRFRGGDDFEAWSRRVFGPLELFSATRHSALRHRHGGCWWRAL